MGKLYITGFGPGDADNMTQLCRRRLSEADIIIGYSGYTRLLRNIFPRQDFLETGMRHESERCRRAIELAAEGKTVCLVSSGDSGIYGMAGLVFELAESKPGLEIELIPGVTAALSGAALLGAPIGHDFAVISLSDLLTPWEIIARRLRAAAAADFALCLYNPGSHQRQNQLRAACDILLELLPESRICGIARNIAREGQSLTLLSLSALRERRCGMEETLFIGNSQTRQINGRMVTPRGYRHE